MDHRAVLAAEHERAVTAVLALTDDLAQMIAAAESSNADDEHDPEGATIAWERAQVSALLDQARRRVIDVERALQQVSDGTYGRCLSCGRPIGTERLAARPASRTCISCAAAAPSGRR